MARIYSGQYEIEHISRHSEKPEYKDLDVDKLIESHPEYFQSDNYNVHYEQEITPVYREVVDSDGQIYEVTDWVNDQKITITNLPDKKEPYDPHAGYGSGQESDYDYPVSTNPTFEQYHENNTHSQKVTRILNQIAQREMQLIQKEIQCLQKDNLHFKKICLGHQLYHDYCVKHRDKRRKAREISKEHIQKYETENPDFKACITQAVGLEDKNKKFRFFAKVFHHDNHRHCDCFTVQDSSQIIKNNHEVSIDPKKQVKRCLGHAEYVISCFHNHTKANEFLRNRSHLTLDRFRNDPNYKNNSALQTHAFKRNAQPFNQNDLFIFFQHKDNHRGCDHCCYVPKKIEPCPSEPELLESPVDLAVKEAIETEQDFSETFSKGMFKGVFEGAQYSFLKSVHSLAELPELMLHVGYFFHSPGASVVDVAGKTLEIATFVKENLNKESLIYIYNTLLEYIKELPEHKKGEYFGFTLGLVATELLSFSLLTKATKWIRKLSESRKIIPKLDREKAKALVEKAVQVAKQREAFAQSCKLNKELQLQHYVENVAITTETSIIYWDLKKVETKTKPLLGTGVPVGLAKCGENGYKEIVKFDEICGKTYVRNLEQYIETNFAKVHYRKNGDYHIVPFIMKNPKAHIWSKFYEK